MTNIGFIGLGHMGHPMVLNLIKAGFHVSVYDVMPAAREHLRSSGAVVCDSIKEIYTSAEVVISSVQTGLQVKEICLGPDGLFQRARPGLLFIDCSSIDISVTHQLHQDAAARGIAMLDAPVSGGVAAATAGTLTIMAGGEEAALQRALPILNALGKKVIHAGVGGSGQAAKICNNIILAISMIGVCEAFSLAKKLELDPKKFFEISSHASGQCWSMTSYCPEPGLVEQAPSNRDYAPGFMAKMMLKDLRLGQHAAEFANASIPLGAQAAELYELFVNLGNGEKDFSAIMQMIEGRVAKR